MRRMLGFVLLLAGSVFLAISLPFLYATYVSILFGGRSFFDVIPALLATAFITIAVFILRRAARILMFRRLAFGGAVVATVALIVLVVAGTALSVSEWSPCSRQKRTMSDLRNIAAALEARAEAENAYPAAANFQALEPYLAPKYIRVLPLRDHWGHPLRYEVQGPAAAPDQYAIASAGKDGVWQRAHLRDYTRAGTTNFDDDIVFRNGEFVQFPDSGPHPH